MSRRRTSPLASHVSSHLKEGSFPVTLVRMCRIRQNEGASFSAASPEIESIRFALTLFLSFVSGQSVGSALPVGFAQNGEKQFVEWARPMSTRSHNLRVGMISVSLIVCRHCLSGLSKDFQRLYGKSRW